MASADDRSGKITRREFLDGVAIGSVGLAIAAANPWMTGAQAAALANTGPTLPPGYYPPTEEGLTGIRDNMLSRVLAIDGMPNPADPHSTVGGPGISRKSVNSREHYDCVIVGAGASGLSAAKYYRDRFGADKKILILDPMADFGGHSHRNEFHVPDAGNSGADVMILRNGGTVNLDSIGTWGLPRVPSSTSRRRMLLWRSSTTAGSIRTTSRPPPTGRRRHSATTSSCSRKRIGVAPTTSSEPGSRRTPTPAGPRI